MISELNTKPKIHKKKKDALKVSFNFFVSTTIKPWFQNLGIIYGPMDPKQTSKN